MKKMKSRELINISKEKLKKENEYLKQSIIGYKFLLLALQKKINALK